MELLRVEALSGFSSLTQWRLLPLRDRKCHMPEDKGGISEVVVLRNCEK